ncbi:MAG: peptide chain release factor N(5)-glutamine methyltransferase [Bacteriovoracaceae bacterium]|nr:peptide chain release factor N(5)-glutamine methyltransferase [Bacteriovoracaceae bacterium]
MTPQSLPTYKTILNSFFDDHKESLELNYPGISLRILSQQVENYILDHNVEISDVYVSGHRARFQTFLNKLKMGIPLGQICGRCYFYRSEFYVDSNVLIPRSETEILVENAARILKKKQKEAAAPLRVLDLGTGSGAIILSLMQECPNLQCFALDLSLDALSVARRNYFQLQYTISPKSELHFICGDRFSNFPDGELDLIVTNPPYIKESDDREGVHNNVHSFEPKIALYLADDEYDQWFEELFKESFKRLTIGGAFLMEGHENHLLHLKLLAENAGFANVIVICDYTGRDRFLSALK